MRRSRRSLGSISDHFYFRRNEALPPRNRAAAKNATPTIHCVFVGTTPSRVLRDGVGIFLLYQQITTFAQVVGQFGGYEPKKSAMTALASGGPVTSRQIG